MSDRFPARISIGGKMSEDKVASLIKAIAKQGCSLEYGDADFAPVSKQELLDVLDENNHLTLVDDQARGGEFEPLESSLMDLGLAWERQSDSYAEYDAEIVYWQPGMEMPIFVTCDASGNETCLMEPVRKAYKLLQSGFNLHVKSDESACDKAMKLLKECVVEIPKLPAFEIGSSCRD